MASPTWAARSWCERRDRRGLYRHYCSVSRPGPLRPGVLNRHGQNSAGRRRFSGAAAARAPERSWNSWRPMSPPCAGDELLDTRGAEALIADVLRGMARSPGAPRAEYRCTCSRARVLRAIAA
jgi:hypothetical protein